MTDRLIDETPAVEAVIDPAGPTVAAPGGATTSAEDAQRTFSTSIVVSGIRCLLTYVVFPFVAPLVGLASGVGPSVGLVIGTVAIAANVMSIRRFWSARHPWRKPITALNVAVICLLAFLVVEDISALVTP